MANAVASNIAQTKSAPLQELKRVFLKYASINIDGEKYLSYEDFVIRFLKILPEEHYDKETLSLFAGVLDQRKCGFISFSDFVAFEKHLCKPDALYRTAFQLFDRDGEGTVSFSEFSNIMNKTTLHKCIPFHLEGSFVQVYFGRNRQRDVSYREFSQFLHDYHKRYSKYAFKNFDQSGHGTISLNDFCTILFTIKSHLLTPKVQSTFKEFIEKTEGTKLNYAYCTAFQSLLSEILWLR